MKHRLFPMSIHRSLHGSLHEHDCEQRVPVSDELMLESKHDPEGIEQDDESNKNHPARGFVPSSMKPSPDLRGGDLAQGGA